MHWINIRQERIKIRIVYLMSMGNKTLKKQRHKHQIKSAKKKISRLNRLLWKSLIKVMWLHTVIISIIIMGKFLLMRFSVKNFWWKMPIINLKTLILLTKSKVVTLSRWMVSIMFTLRMWHMRITFVRRTKLNAKNKVILTMHQHLIVQWRLLNLKVAILLMMATSLMHLIL